MLCDTASDKRIIHINTRIIHINTRIWLVLLYFHTQMYNLIDVKDAKKKKFTSILSNWWHLVGLYNTCNILPDIYWHTEGYNTWCQLFKLSTILTIKDCFSSKSCFVLEGKEFFFLAFFIHRRRYGSKNYGYLT